ncbi:non-homologous end joining protein Ku [Quadrisphaera setariae]|uniref:Non-homologous end joining protein Ku n=1 Tax=Quadrisphaera setariae TaxID=2593304 RepID=A0A5C8Z349_9ACTN|nr:Ku protein [Quadrisphaera setariae]TXR51744.1 Ku protein [Quadrisphaera setariae]
MRAIWKGAVSFGLVNVPVRVYAATGTKDVSFHQVHAADGGRIRYQRTCSVDGEPVAYGDIAKGYETDDGDLVVLSDADLAALPLATGREIEVVEFVPEAQVDPLMYDKAYYLEPDRTAAKPYALLREALARTERVAVVKVALRQRETLAVLRVRGNVICLQTVLWPDEVREPEFEVLGADVALKPAEMAMAASLVESLAADFDPTQYADGYREAVRALVEEKIASGDVRRAPAVSDGSGAGEDGDGEVVDLLAALRRSVERAKARRGETADGGGGDGASGGSEPVPARSTTRGRGAPTKKKTTKSA